MIYNGMGGSERVLMSDLRKPTKDENPTPTRLFQKRQKHRVKNFVIEGKK